MSCRGRVRAVVAVAVAALLAACGEPASDDSADATSAGIASVTFRLWDPAAADAYRESFDAFNAIHRDIHVDVEIVPEDSYAARAASDLADGVMADVFWTTSDAVAAHAHAGDLVELGEVLGEDRPAWEPSVTSLYTRDDALWAVPQVWDSTVLFYNTELVEQAGVDPAALTWDPAVVHDPSPDNDGEAETDGPAAAAEAPEEAAGDEGGDGATEEATPPPDDASAAPPTDTLRRAVRELTRDSEGHPATAEEFDPRSVAEWGINPDLTAPAVWLPFTAQLGGVPADDLVLTEPSALAAFTYLTALPAAPAGEAAQTPARELFADGRLALFQSSSAVIRELATAGEVDWGMAPVPAGPDGVVSVVDGVAAAANAASTNPEATAEVVRWIASPDGQAALASHGIGVPAATGAQELFLQSWADRGVDAAAVVGTEEVVTAASGPRAQEVLQAIRPILADMFAGERGVTDALATAQQAAEETLGSMGEKP